MTKTKIKKTTLELSFPILKGTKHTNERQFDFINQNISLMEKFKNESTNEELCYFIALLESKDYFNFYHYQKQNLNTDYRFFTSSDSKLGGNTSREVTIKSKTDLNYQIQIRFVQTFYNHIMSRLFDLKSHDKNMVAKLIENSNEFNSSQCFEEAA
jgi:hypothetical protein